MQTSRNEKTCQAQLINTNWCLIQNDSSSYSRKRLSLVFQTLLEQTWHIVEYGNWKWQNYKHANEHKITYIVWVKVLENDKAK